jgi:hypothetical protein
MDNAFIYIYIYIYIYMCVNGPKNFLKWIMLIYIWMVPKNLKIIKYIYLWPPNFN